MAQMLRRCTGDSFSQAYRFGMGFLKMLQKDDLETAHNRLVAFNRKLTSACLLDYGNNLDMLTVKLPDYDFVGDEERI